MKYEDQNLLVPSSSSRDTSAPASKSASAASATMSLYGAPMMCYQPSYQMHNSAQINSSPFPSHSSNYVLTSPWTDNNSAHTVGGSNHPSKHVQPPASCHRQGATSAAAQQ